MKLNGVKASMGINMERLSRMRCDFFGEATPPRCRSVWGNLMSRISLSRKRNGLWLEKDTKVPEALLQPPKVRLSFATFQPTASTKLVLMAR